MSDLPKFEIIQDPVRHSLLIQFDHEEWVDHEKAIDILSIRLGPILESYINTPMNNRGTQAVGASVTRFLIAMRNTNFIFLRQEKWDLDEEW